jgi:hypothetical protein
MERGVIAIADEARRLQGNQEVIDRYLGGAEEEHPAEEKVIE